MPQMIAIGLVGLLAYYAWRIFRREMARIGREMEQRRRRAGAKDAGSLEAGPDGVYRPRRPARIE